MAVLKGQDNPPKVEGNNSKTLGSLYPQLTRTDDDDVHDISQGQGHQTSNQGRQGHQGRPGNNDLQDQPSFKSQKSSAEQPGDFQLGDIDFKVKCLRSYVMRRRHYIYVTISYILIT